MRFLSNDTANITFYVKTYFSNFLAQSKQAFRQSSSQLNKSNVASKMLKVKMTQVSSQDSMRLAHKVFQ